MTIHLDPGLRRWAETTGGDAFCTTLRKWFGNRGKISGWMPVPGCRNDIADEIKDLFGDGNVVDEGKVHLARADAALRRTRFRIGLRQLTIGLDGPIITDRGRARYRRIVNTARVRGERADLVAVMTPVSHLDRERRLLEQLKSSATRQVPAESATETRSWRTYVAAIRASAYWWPLWNPKEPPWERQVAANALGGSKKWTVRQLEAFALLIDKDYKDALSWPDAPIRVAGKLRWTHEEDIVANASAARPWIDVPARGVLAHGDLACEAEGVLLVENITNFQDLAKRPEVVRDWLVVWTEGNPSTGLVPFLQRLNVMRFAAWCDLDPPGIEIIASVERGLDRTIIPVGMEPEMWQRGAKLEEDPDELQRWQHQAVQLAANGPPLLRALAARIATTGQRCEQEGLISEVTPQVLLRLCELVRGTKDPNS
ncbi:Wadjet anti-phage system protein JetD domain-containing protein [Lentzea sp. NPDC034063]|uniref:Wadjet anti-phage system protein JetD domain-containing protein n=1 Tax=unclassified Lentzea TaxID=2643253 RepID=UPI0033D07BD0